MANYQKSKEKRAFTLSEAAEYACVSQSTIKNWLAKGMLPYEELPSRGIGHHRFRRIRKDDLDEFLNQFYLLNNTQSKKKLNNELILLPRNT